MIFVRSAGQLLHVTSLPSRFGRGDLGPAARDFVTALSEAGQAFWQVLPLHPTLEKHQHSPYHATSTFAINPLFISPEVMADEGIIGRHQLKFLSEPPGASAQKTMAFLVQTARQNCCGREDAAYERFCRENRSWLDDYALFAALSRDRGADWSAWPPGIRDRDPAALMAWRKELCSAREEEQYLQYLVFSQWGALREHASRCGVRIIGDLPVYPAYESADVWAHRDLFRLDRDGRPLAVAGVPPDYFSRTGQWWGNPVFAWEEMERQGFSWWVDRVSHALSLCDIVRVDHFRGLVSAWEIPAGAATAAEGCWVTVPGRALLSCLAARFPDLPLVAEDLGTITEEVRALREAFGIPGMRVLQFGFDGDPENPHAPCAIGEEVVLYTGTHDNNTIRGWFEEEIGPGEKERIASALGGLPAPAAVSRELISFALESPARVVIVPVQDLLGLSSRARMNRPGTTEGNWRWRLSPGEPGEEDWAWLSAVTCRSGRVENYTCMNGDSSLCRMT